MVPQVIIEALPRRSPQHKLMTSMIFLHHLQHIFALLGEALSMLSMLGWGGGGGGPGPREIIWLQQAEEFEAVDCCHKSFFFFNK